MKLLVDIQDNKAAFMIELLNSFSFVKAKTISPAKARFISELSKAVEELNQIKAGKKKGRPAKELLSEL